jgi:predicted membrane GTPase involved in stress response
MNLKLTAVERAFQLAGSGEVATLSDLRARLRREGYDLNHIVGPALLRQLRTLIANPPEKA